ncbi:MAG: [FeFe] hydrogenase H-cluster maturation GTPase HydF [Candidatus Firestonebacteria bacterium]
MLTTPKSLRLQIGIFGRTNVGKSSFLNLVSGQDVSIVSSIPGTTTDVVEKVMELLPLGPVVFLDTAGFDDKSLIGNLRIKKTVKIFDRADVIILVVEPGIWSSYEKNIISKAKKNNISLIIVVNKIDLKKPSKEQIKDLKKQTKRIIFCSSTDYPNRDVYVNELKKHLIEISPDEYFNPPSLVGDLMPAGGLAIFVIPIDLEAPKGRLILPQVQAMRDVLDNNQAVITVKESEYAQVLRKLKKLPDLVVSDSQAVLKMVEASPKSVKCTTFSMLFARSKGDIVEFARGAVAIKSLKSNNKILIAEACSHHAIEDDIGRVKIPKWLKRYVGGNIKIDVASGRDYPDDLSGYKLIIHCGACMLTRREMLSRMQKAKEANIPITNYGIAISFLQGVLERTLSPFPSALRAFKEREKY